MMIPVPGQGDNYIFNMAQFMAASTQLSNMNAARNNLKVTTLAPVKIELASSDLTLHVRCTDAVRSYLGGFHWTELKPILNNYVAQHVLAAPVHMGDDTQKEMRICTPKAVVDAFGQFYHDPLEGLFSIVLQRRDGSAFPALWQCTGDVSAELANASQQAVIEAQSLVLWVQRTFAESRREGAKDIIEKLSNHNINSLAELANLPDDFFRLMWDQHAKVGDVQFLDQKRKSSSVSASTKDSSFAELNERERLARIHRIKLTLAEGKASLPLLDPKVCELAKIEIQALLKNNVVVTEMFDRFVTLFTQKLTSPPRGCLLFGPPGTGKTLFATEIVRLCGFLSVTDAFISPGDLNRRHVGETEKVVNDLCDRSRLSPFVPWIFPIDEIESAVAKRSATDSSGHKSDVVSIFLRRFGERSDVPQLYLVGATNRREAIDPAVVRRMPVHVFSGYPTVAERKDILKAKLGGIVIDYLKDPTLEQIAHQTVNFSGAALAEVARELLSEWERCGNQQDFQRSLDQTISLVLRRVAKSLKIEVNGVSMPDVLSMASSITKLRRDNWLRQVERCTGLAVIRVNNDDTLIVQHESYLPQNEMLCYDLELDLRPRCDDCDRFGGILCVPGKVHMEEYTLAESYDELSLNRALQFTRQRPVNGLGASVERYNAACKYTYEARDDLGVTSSISIPKLQVVRELCFFATERRLDRVFFIDINTFMGMGAFSEQGFIEEVDGIARQATASGSRTLLIFDLDSLAGVQMSSSSESGGSDNFSMCHSGLFDRCVDIFLSCRRRAERKNTHGEAVVFEVGHNAEIKSECWAFALVCNAYVERCFRKKSGFRQLKSVEASAELKRCTRCQEQFSDDGADGCYRHWGSVIVLKKDEATGIVSTEVLSDESVMNGDATMRFITEVEMDNHRSTRMLYSCCGSPFGGIDRCYRCEHESRPTLPATVLPAKYLFAVGDGTPDGPSAATKEERIKLRLVNMGSSTQLWNTWFAKNDVTTWPLALVRLEGIYGLGIPSDAVEDDDETENSTKISNDEITLPAGVVCCEGCRLIRNSSSDCSVCLREQTRRIP